MKKRINVTRRDIEQGQPRNGFLCPVARAIKRAFGAQSVSATVNGATVRVGNPEHWIKTDMPLRARLFMTAFDGDAAVEPIRFTITY